MTATGSGTPIYDALVELLPLDDPHSQSGAHSKPVETAPCTPVEWFGPTPDPVHARHSDTTVVKPVVRGEPEARVS